MRLEIGAYMEYSSSFVDWQTYPLRMMEVPNDFITNFLKQRHSQYQCVTRTLINDGYLGCGE